jgi:hypothetical protein
MSERINSAQDLTIYQKAYGLSMEIFELSKGWPMDERYSLIDQIRRSSRSVCANLREAWSKRRYEAPSCRIVMGKIAKRILGWIMQGTVGIFPKSYMQF